MFGERFVQFGVYYLTKRKPSFSMNGIIKQYINLKDAMRQSPTKSQLLYLCIPTAVVHITHN